jgi:hypothetical protein
MPSRAACVAILLFWVYASVELLRRDVLPDFWVTPPPDLRSIAAAEEDARPTQWELSVAEDSGFKGLRPVGRAVTESKRTLDGGTELIGHVWFDSGSLLKGTKFDSQRNERLDISNRLEIDPSGNLRQFRAVVHSALDSYELITLDGTVKGRSIEIKAKSPAPLPLLNWTKSFPYEPRGMIQNSIGPIDRLPGLQVGQRWVTRVVSPLTGRVEDVKVEVTGKHAIQWDNNVVDTLEVVQHLTPISARTWVRKDGLVLRQEVPFPFVKLILERLPDRGGRGKIGANPP